MAGRTPAMSHRTNEDVNGEEQGKASDTNRGESCVGFAGLGVDAAGDIRLRRVLGLRRRLAGIDVHDAQLVLVGRGKVGPSDAIPAPVIDDDCDNAHGKYA